MSDLFPSAVESEYPLQNSLCLLQRHSDKHFFIRLPRVTAFLFKLNGKCLEYGIAKQGMPADWKETKLRDNYQRTLKEATRPCTAFDTSKMDFERLQRRYERDYRPQHNTDVRLGFSLNPNEFVVKAYFTFGQRTVPRGLVHLYRTTDMPIVFYAFPREMTNARFRGKDQYVCDKFVMQPHSTYAVRGGETYMIMTLKKTAFCIHVVSELEDSPERRAQRIKLLQDEQWKCPRTDTKFYAYSTLAFSSLYLSHHETEREPSAKKLKTEEASHGNEELWMSPDNNEFSTPHDYLCSMPTMTGLSPTHVYNFPTSRCDSMPTLPDSTDFYNCPTSRSDSIQASDVFKNSVSNLIAETLWEYGQSPRTEDSASRPQTISYALTYEQLMQENQLLKRQLLNKG